MNRWMKWLISPTVLGTLGLLILTVLIWWLGPLLGPGQFRPLSGWVARTTVIALLWLGWVAWLLWRALRLRRTNAALLRGISTGATASERESQALQERFLEATVKLRAAGKGRSSWLSSTSSLYELPWYVFVGAPGSGKTTALQNAGLQFLLTDGSNANAVKGVGGTRNCDWWFTSDAVLIDTAGRYATQESDSDVDAKAWENFLSLLRKSRPRRPINGALLTINIQDLLQQNSVERQEHARKLRDRLHELQSKLGVRVPVYVLITKTDLVAGFNETFDSLGKELRDQVWGFTFDASTPAAQLRSCFDTEFKALELNLNASLLERLQAERDVGKRAALFGFPMEFANLRPVLGDFLGMVFAGGGALMDELRLRGVYFTSGTQEGTPIDRVMNSLSRSFGLQSRTPAAGVQRGRSYFLRRLLQEVIFAEQHLVAANPVAERRRTLLRSVGFAAVALSAVVCLAVWAVSYSRNQAYSQQLAAKVPELKKLLDSVPPAVTGDVSPLPSALSAVHDAARSPDYEIGNPPLLNSFGLYQG